MITLTISFIYALLGLIIGSFLNVVILRRGARTVGGRSGCLSCGAPLRVYDLIPIVSWLLLRGRCRDCGTRISMQYPIVEGTTALLFGIVGSSGIAPYLEVVGFAICAILVLVAAYDIRHTIIPDEWSYGFGILALASSMPFALVHGGAAGVGLLLAAGPVAALPLFLLWLVSHGRWMGFGDVKLAFGIGWLLGLSTGLFAVFFAFVIGAVVSVCILMPVQYLEARIGAHRLKHQTTRFTMKSEVPFGPFLIASCLIVWLLGVYGIVIPLFTFV
jgi:leader peptidase (prepilin peptidase)/N-methyltransferase